MRATYDYAEPGVIFIDRDQRRTNNLCVLREHLRHEPCGEQPLPPYGACLLGSVDLARVRSSIRSGRGARSTRQRSRASCRSRCG